MKSLLIMRDGRRVNLASAISPELYAELEGTQGDRHLHQTREHPARRVVRDTFRHRDLLR